MAAWFMAPNRLLDSQAPAALLEDRDAQDGLLKAAEDYAQPMRS